MGETSGGFSGCMSMIALNVVQDIQFGNVCLLSSTSYEATWSWICIKHFGRNFFNYSRDTCQMNTKCCQVKQSYLKLFPGKGEARSVKNCKLEKMELVRAVLELSPNCFV